MSCERYEELISLSVSGELTAGEQSELRRHLAECEGCRLVMAREQRLWALIEKGRKAEGVPAGFRERLASEVLGKVPAAHPRLPQPRRRWMVWVAAAAGLLVAVVFLRAVTKTPPKPKMVSVGEVTGGKLLVAEGDGWRETDRLFSGRFYAVPAEPGSEARLKLADGSRLRVERAATFRLHRGLSQEVAGTRTVELRAGTLTAGVAEDKSEKFVVDAPGGKVTATGTRFWVRAGPPEGEKEEKIMGKKDIVTGAMATALAVAVFEGSVLVQIKEAGAAEAVAIRAGEETKPTAAPEGVPTVAARTVASAVPADALLFIAAAGRAHWIKAVEDSVLGAAYREEQVNKFLKPAVEKIEARIKELKANAEKGVGNTLKFDEIERALQGEVGMAILGIKVGEPGAEGKAAEEKPIFLFVAEVGEHAEAFETGMGEFIKRVQLMLEREGGGKGATLNARTYRGADLRTFTVEEVTIAYARTKGYFLLALDPAVVEKGIDCLEGKARSLAEGARIRKTAGGLLKVSVNAAAWLKHERAKNPDKKDWKELDALGFTATGRVEYRLNFEKPIFREELRAEITRAEGMMALLKHAKPVDAAKLAADVPADALAFMAFNLPAEKILPTVFETAKRIGGEKGTEDIRKGLEEMKKHGLDIEAMLSEALTGELAAYAVLVPDAPMPDVVVVARLKADADVLGNLKALAMAYLHQEAVKRATSRTPEGKPYIDALKVREFMEKFTPQTVDYRGGKMIYFPVAKKKTKDVVPAAIVLSGRLIVASSDKAAKRAAARIGAGRDLTLAGKEAFAGSLKKLPAGPLGVQYVDTARVFEIIYALAAPGIKKRAGLKEKWGLDMEKLPPAGAISKHLVPEVAALYADPKGLALRAFTNVPRGALLGAFALSQQKHGGKAGHAGGRPDDPKPKAGDPEPDIEEF